GAQTGVRRGKFWSLLVSRALSRTNPNDATFASVSIPTVWGVLCDRCQHWLELASVFRKCKPDEHSGRLPGASYDSSCFQTGMMEPKRPSASSLKPAAKKRVFVLPAIAPFPKANPHRPLIVIGLRLLSVSWPRKAPLIGSKALMCPSPKLPTSRSLL